VPDAADILRRNLAYLPRLDGLLERYLTFGGLPAAVAEAATGVTAPSVEVMRVLWDSLEREVAGPGASGAALVALLERVARSLGSKTSWSALAREMDVPLGGRRTTGDYRTVKQYVERLSRAYFLLVLYFWKAGSDSNDLSRDKKVYFGDPLLHTITLEKAPGLARDLPAAVENAVALALYRHYEPVDVQAEGYAGPERLHAWETKKPNEIDFVCGPRAALEMIEVKFRSHIGLADTLVMRQSFPGRPHVLVTRDVLRLEDEHAWIPASLLLWALG
jgi:predicted AAA+ superfamily ATPase